MLMMSSSIDIDIYINSNKDVLKLQEDLVKLTHASVGQRLANAL